MKDRYGVVNEDVRNKYEKEWQVSYGYDFISFDYSIAKKVCKDKGEGHIVERISGSEREIVYRG